MNLRPSAQALPSQRPLAGGVRPLARAGARTWRALVVIACLAMLLGAPVPQIDSDTPLSGEIAQHILATGDWLTLRYPVHYSSAIVDKPPLTYWLMAVSIWLGGPTNAALRLWCILMAMLLVLTVYGLARLDCSEEESLLAALIMATFQQVFYETSLAPQHDIPVTLFLTLTFYSYLRYRRDGRARWTLLAGFWAALAVLTKGILFLPGILGVVAADALLAWRRGERPRWRVRHVAAGGLVFTLAAAPWFVVEALRLGPPFLRMMLVGAGGLERLRHPFLGAGFAGLEGYVAAWLAYVPLLIVGMLPWTALLPGAIAQGWRSLRGDAPSARLSAVWFALYFAAISLSQGDRSARYLLPCYPPLALLAGRALAGALARGARLGAGSLLLPLLGPLALWAGVWVARRSSPVEMQAYTPILVPILAVLTLVVVALTVLAGRGLLRQAVALAAAGSVLSYTVTYAMLVERWAPLWPWPAIGATVNRLYHPGDRVLIVGRYTAEANLAAYWIRPPIERVDDDALVAAWHRERILALLAPDRLAALRDRLHPTVLLRTPMGWSLVTNR